MSTSYRDELHKQMIKLIDDGYDLMHEYDLLPHKYGPVMLYQSEAKVIEYIGKHENVTITDLSTNLGKTTSAYSQIVRKLKGKGWVEQVRNADNNREYILFLTEEGWKVFWDHEHFEQHCLQRTYEGLAEFSDADIRTFCKIFEKLNVSFKLDVEDSYKNEDLSDFRA